MRRFLKRIGVFLLCVLLIEGSVRFFRAQFPESHYWKSTHELILKSFDEPATDLEQQSFCDLWHKTESAQKKTAELILQAYPALRALPKVSPRPVVWIFGGSTTKGNACIKVLPTPNWPWALQQALPHVELRSFAENGITSDVSIKLLQEALEKEEAPDMILMAHWVNEILSTVTSHHENFEKLSPDLKDAVLQFQQSYEPSDTAPLWADIKIILFLLSLSDQHLLLSYQLLSNVLEQHLFPLMPEDAVATPARFLELVLEKGYSLPGGFFETPQQLHDFVQNFQVPLGLENYSHNMQKLRQLQTEHGFQVALVTLPYFTRYYAYRYPAFHQMMMYWFEQINQHLSQVASTHGWVYLDVHQAFWRESQN